MAITNGELIDADELMNAFGTNFNDTAQNIFNADYIGFDARIRDTGLPGYKNIFYSTFTSDDVDINYLFDYNSTDDLYEAPDLSGINEYILIEADEDDIIWTSNDCNLLKITSGKWILFCTTGTDEVHRAQINKSLWYGTTGSDQLISDFTNVTAVKTSTTRDVGKRAVKTTFSVSGVGSSYAERSTGTFADTSTNVDYSSWSRFSNTGDASAGGNWDVPSGSVLHNFSDPSGGGGTTDDETGTDLTADERDNPATARGYVSVAAGSTFGSCVCVSIALQVGAITWVNDGGQYDEGSTTMIDYFDDNSIPLMTLAGSLISEGVATSTLIFKDTSTPTDNAIPVVNFFAPIDHSDEITNNSFEDVIAGEWSYSETHNNFSAAARTSGAAYDGSYYWSTGSSGNVPSGETAQLQQTGVDLSTSTNIGVRINRASGADVFEAKLFIGDTEIASAAGADLDASWQLLTGTIPADLRLSNQTIKLKLVTTATWGASSIWFDFVQIWDEETTPGLVYSVSTNGGVNWTVSNNGEIARGIEGTDLWRKFEITRTDLGSTVKVTEQAVKYGLY